MPEWGAGAAVAFMFAAGWCLMLDGRDERRAGYGMGTVKIVCGVVMLAASVAIFVLIDRALRGE